MSTESTADQSTKTKNASHCAKVSTSSVIHLGNLEIPNTPSPLPGDPTQLFHYFNLHDDRMLPLIQEGARLLHQGVPSGLPLYTVETSTYELAYVLRASYGREVHTLTKRVRPDTDLARVTSIEYLPITSVTPSTVFYNPDVDCPQAHRACHPAGPPFKPVEVVFFDNVLTTGHTAEAATRLLRRHNVIVVAIYVLFTEGPHPIDHITVSFSEKETETMTQSIPVFAFGHLPLFPAL